jgi:hypothetical protein
MAFEAITVPRRGVGTVVNATITAGGTAQQILPAQPGRIFLEIKNNAAQVLWVNFGAVAAIDSGVQVAAIGVGDTWRSPPNYCPTGLVSVVGATTANKFSYIVQK